MIVLRGKRADESWDAQLHERAADAEAVGAAWLRSGVSVENVIEPLEEMAARVLTAAGGLVAGARVVRVEQVAPSRTDGFEATGVRVDTERGRERGAVYLRWDGLRGDFVLDVVRSMAADAKRHAARKARR